MKSSALLLAASLTFPAALAAAGRAATLDLTNMDCAVCPITVRKALETVAPVKAKASGVVFEGPNATTARLVLKSTLALSTPGTVRRRLPLIGEAGSVT